MEQVLEFEGGEILRVVVGPLNNNVYIVRSTGSDESILIDAANEPDLLLELCRECHVRMILTTHGHWDHIDAVEELRAAGYSVAVSAADAPRLPSYDVIIEDQELFTIGDQQLRAHLTPGHTDGSICFELVGQPVLFSGDTLFPGGPGATSFEGGDFAQIIDSIEHRIFDRFPPETVILPGHGSSTTISAERPSLGDWIARGW